MKKVVSCLVAFSILILGLSLIGCSNGNQSNEPEIEYEQIQLTKSNYSDYIAINTDYSDYNLIALSEAYTAGQYYYTASLIVHINTASAKPNLRFSNVKITYTISTLTWETGLLSAPSANLDYEGNSRCSFTAVAEHKLIGAISPTIFSSTKSIVNTVDGFVYVPKAS